MSNTTYTSIAHQSATELLAQDAIVRSTHFSDDNCILQLSCQRGFANVQLDGEQLVSVMVNLGITHPGELEGLKVTAYLEAARVVGIGSR